jgi:hypothetical protein
MKTRIVFLSLFLALVVVMTPRGFAQAVPAALLGTVTDQAGSVVPNALVSITNQGTGAATTAHANGAVITLSRC